MLHSFDAVRKPVQITRARSLAAFILLMMGGANAHAQGLPASVVEPRDEPPEVLLVPLKASNQTLVSNGWYLLYRNTLLGPQAPSMVIESRNVTLSDDNERTTTGVISWKIVRTQNHSCASATMPTCPDRIQVLSVPKGFVAVPESAWVDEGDGLRILIVRTAIG